MPHPFLSSIRQWGEAALNLFYPPHCFFCRVETATGRDQICPACRSTAQRLCAPSCQICSFPLDGEITSAFSCPRCRDNPPLFDCAVAPYRTDTVVKEAIHRFKYNQQFHLRHLLGQWLLEALDDPRLRTPRARWPHRRPPPPGPSPRPRLQSSHRFSQDPGQKNRPTDRYRTQKNTIYPFTDAF